jgi:glycolate oxidase iron-sulfur subunit
MYTKLTESIQSTRAGQEAAAIISKCVHCGFCTATCPTYQLLGNELDGPRGRIYLIKQIVEGHPATAKTQLHLDRCLTCRSCESTCPSGVEYGHLVEIGRELVDAQVPRPLLQSLTRTALKTVLPRSWLFSPILRSGQLLRPLLPKNLATKIPKKQAAGIRPGRSHQRKMLMLEGCVQPSLSPNINNATARVLDRFGIQLLPASGCCGALRSHLSDREGGLADARRNIDAWLPQLDSGIETLVMTASGCGSMVKDYGHLLAHDPLYADKAARVSAATKDISDILFELRSQFVVHPQMTDGSDADSVAYHPPCTLQHGQQNRGKVEQILEAVGIPVKRCADSHLCCGSAGTYSILQPELSVTLRDQKLQQLQATGASSIVSANIGCIGHLQSGTATPVRHWIELLELRLV